MVEARNILILSDNVGTDYVSRIENGAERSAGATAYSVLAENLHQSRRAFDEVLSERDYAGIILTAPVSDDRHILLQLEQRKIPFVRIASMLDLDRGANVLLDEYEAARAVTDYLIERGHRRIGILKGPRQHLVSMRRFNGYANAMGGKKLKIEPELVAEGDFSRESGHDNAKRLLAAKPTAIFACNDEMAVGIMEFARDAGIQVPGQLSIVGYDDNPIASQVRPALTSVRQPLGQMGDTAMKLMAECIQSPAKPPQNVTLQLEVVERNSVATLFN